MAVKILIKRTVPAKKARELIPLFQRLRTLAMTHPGYISGETLASAEDPQLLLVIATWQDLESWHKWQANATRQTLEKMLGIYQESATEYQEFILGGFIEE